MSFLSKIEHFFSVTEQDVLTVIVKFKQGLEVGERDVSYALGWIADNIGQIDSYMESVLSIAQVVGAVNPTVEAAIVAAHEAVAALDAFAAAYKSGTGTVHAVASGYSALKLAQAAAAKATAAAVSAPSLAPAAAAAA